VSALRALRAWRGWRPSARAALALSLLASAVACEQPRVAQGRQEGARSTASQSERRVLARVREAVITRADLERRLKRLPSITRRSYEPLERQRELLESMLRFELLAQRARAEGLGEHLSVQLAYAAALSEALQAQGEHEELTQESGALNPQPRAGDELEVLFLAPELREGQSASPSGAPSTTTP